jgi:hypothetical protein
MFQNLLAALWGDDRGAVLTPEWIMVATILVIGVLTGLIAVRQTVMARALDLAGHAQASNQSYSFSGQASCEAATGGSAFTFAASDGLVVRSTAAVPGGVSAHACD